MKIHSVSSLKPLSKFCMCGWVFVKNSIEGRTFWDVVLRIPYGRDSNAVFEPEELPHRENSFFSLMVQRIFSFLQPGRLLLCEWRTKFNQTDSGHTTVTKVAHRRHQWHSYHQHHQRLYCRSLCVKVRAWSSNAVASMPGVHLLSQNSNSERNWTWLSPNKSQALCFVCCAWW